MENGYQENQLYDKFIALQRENHRRNQKKIRIGLKVNILLPLVFLLLSFLTERSKLVFLVLWIVSLFGIAFYLLYVEYTDFKVQEQLKDLGILEDGAKTQALIGDELLQGIDEIHAVREEVKTARDEMVKDLKEKKEEFKSEIKSRGDKKNEEHS